MAKKNNTSKKKCSWCGHSRDRHSAAIGCLGDGSPGANCACDEFVKEGRIED